MEYNIGKYICVFIVVAGLITHACGNLLLLQYVWLVIPTIYAFVDKTKKRALKGMLVGFFLYLLHALIEGNHIYMLWILTPYTYIFFLVYAENEIENLTQYKRPGMIRSYEGSLSYSLNDIFVCMMTMLTVIIGYVSIRTTKPVYSQAYLIMSFCGIIFIDVLRDLYSERHELVEFIINDAITKKLEEMRVTDTDVLYDAHDVFEGKMLLSDYVFKHGFNHVDDIFMSAIVNNPKVERDIKIQFSKYCSNVMEYGIDDDKRLMYSQYEHL